MRTMLRCSRNRPYLFSFVAGACVSVVLVFSQVIHAQNQDRKSGSAFAVDTSGKLLTNSHVVEGCSDVTATSPGRSPLNGRVIARDPRNDLALISVGTSLGSIAAFRRVPIRAGDDVVALGFPLRGLLAADLNVSKGIVSATAGLLNDTSQLQISAGVQPGNSGGPLLDSSGLVSGVVVAKLDAIAVAQAIGDIPQNINFAIKAEIAQIFLRSQGVEPRLGLATAPALAAADVVQSARPYTFVIDCDPGRLARQLQAEAARKAEEERQAAQRRADVEREAAAARQRIDREQADRVAAERRKAEEENIRFWATHDIRQEQCVRPDDVGISDWNRLNARQQWEACTKADTILRICAECSGETGTALRQPNGFARVIDAGFTSRAVDLKRVASGAYRNTFDSDGRWISMFARVVGLSESDRVELTLTAPDGTVLIGNKADIRRGAGGDTVLWVGKARSSGHWSPGPYTARIRALRNGAEFLNYSGTVIVAPRVVFTGLKLRQDVNGVQKEIEVRLDFNSDALLIETDPYTDSKPKVLRTIAYKTIRSAEYTFSGSRAFQNHWLTLVVGPNGEKSEIRLNSSKYQATLDELKTRAGVHVTNFDSGR